MFPYGHRSYSGRGEGGDGEPEADGYGVTFEDVILLYIYLLTNLEPV